MTLIKITTNNDLVKKKNPELDNINSHDNEFNIVVEFQMPISPCVTVNKWNPPCVKIS